MKPAKTFKTDLNKLITRQSNFLKKAFFIGIMVALLSILLGCQDQMVSMKPKNVNYPISANKVTLKSVSSQLATEVTLNEDNDKETSIPKSNDTFSTSMSDDILRTQLNKTSLPKSSLNKDSWKETYDGKGIPLFRITF
jgi:hypothetical protein